MSNLQRLYENLGKIDKNFTRSYDEFVSDMQDVSKRKRLHQSLSQIDSGFNRTLDEFTSDMGFSSPSSSQPWRVSMPEYTPMQKNSVQDNIKQQQSKNSEQRNELLKPQYITDGLPENEFTENLFRPNQPPNKMYDKDGKLNPSPHQPRTFTIQQAEKLGMVATPENHMEATRIDIANQILRSAEKTLNAPAKGDPKLASMVRGVKEADLDLFDLKKINESGSALKVANKLVANKPLTTGENAILDALAVRTAAEIERKDDISNWYAGGKGATEMAPFIAEFVLMGGIGKAATKGAEKALVKAVEGKVKNIIAKRVAQLGVKAATRTVAGGIGAVAAPMAISGTLEGMTGYVQPETDTEGNITGSEFTDRKGLGESYYHAWRDTAVEFITEMSGGSLGVMGKFMKEVPVFSKLTHALSGTKFGNVTKVLGANPHLKQVGIQGFLGEYNEEFDGALIRQVLFGESFKENFANKDAQATLLLTLAPMGGFSAASNGISAEKSRRSYKKSDATLSETLSAEGYSESDINNLKNTLLTSTPEEAQSHINNFAANAENPQAVAVAMFDYVYDGAKYDAHRSEVLKKEAKRSTAGAPEAIKSERVQLIEHVNSILNPTFGEDFDLTDNKNQASIRLSRITTGKAMEEALSGTAYSLPSTFHEMSKMEQKDMLYDILGNEALTDEQKHSILSYIPYYIADTQIQKQRAQTLNSRKEEAAQSLTSSVNPLTGTLTLANVKGNEEAQGVFIRQNPHPESENETAYYTGQDGKVHPVPLSDLDILEESSLEEQVAAAHELIDRQELAEQMEIEMMIETGVTESLHPAFPTRGEGGSPTDALPTSLQQPDWPVGTQAVDGDGNINVVAGRDEDGNYMLNDESGNPIDRVAPQEMRDWGFEISGSEFQVSGEDNSSHTLVNGRDLTDEERSIPEKQTLEEAEQQAFYDSLPVVQKGKDAGQIDVNAMTTEQLFTYNTYERGITQALIGLQNDYEKLQKVISAKQRALEKADSRGQIKTGNELRALRAELQTITTLISSAREQEGKEQQSAFLHKKEELRAERNERYTGTAGSSIQQRWEEAPKQTGYEDVLTIANGEQIKGRWVLTEAFAATPSHNPETLQSSEGFPTVNGKNINDNDYTSKRYEVEEKANNFDGRAIDDPIFVKDGVVISGNNRTMSGQLAAINSTDGAYMKALQLKGKQKGFTEEQIAAFANPRIYFEVTDPVEFTTETFSKFNARTTKSKSATEKAVVAAKRNDEELVTKIIATVSEFEGLNDFYKSEKAQTEVLKYLIGAGVIHPNDVAELFENNAFTASGKTLLESVIIGNVIHADQIKILTLDGMKQYRAKIVRAIIPLLTNSKKGELSLLPELNEAIIYLYNADSNLLDYFSTQNVFERLQFNLNAVILAIALQRNDFVEFIETNNKQLDGSVDLFEGRPLTKEDVYGYYQQRFTETERAVYERARLRQDQSPGLGQADLTPHPSPQGEGTSRSAEDPSAAGDGGQAVQPSGERTDSPAAGDAGAGSEGEIVGNSSPTPALTSGGEGKSNVAFRGNVVQFAQAVAARNKALQTEAERLQLEFNTPVELHRGLDTVKNKKARAQISKGRTPGWYADGKVHIYLPHSVSVKDIQETFFHEVVGHKGLRELLGDKFSYIMTDFFGRLPKEEQLNYFNHYRNHPAYKDFTDTEIQVVVAEEFISQIAEKGDFDNAETRNVFQKLVDAIVEFFRKNNVAIQQDDAVRMANGLLRESAERLRNSTSDFLHKGKGREESPLFRSTEGYKNTVIAAAAQYDNARTSSERMAAAFNLAESLNEYYEKDYADYPYAVVADTQDLIAAVETASHGKLTPKQVDSLSSVAGLYFRERIYLVASKNSDAKSFEDTWVHENGHREISRHYSRKQLSAIYDTINSKSPGEVEANIPPEYRRLRNSGKINELIVRNVEYLYSRGNRDIDLAEFNTHSGLFTPEFAEAVKTIFDKIINTPSYGRKNTLNERDSSLSLRRGDGGNLQGNRIRTSENQRIGTTEAGSERGVRADRFDTGSVRKGIALPPSGSPLKGEEKDPSGRGEGEAVRFRTMASEAVRPLENLIPQADTRYFMRVQEVEPRINISDTLDEYDIPKPDDFSNRDIVKPVKRVFNQKNFNYNLYYEGRVFLRPINQRKHLIRYESNERGMPEFNLENVKIFERFFNSYINYYQYMLQRAKYVSTESVQREINQILDDIDYARDYYARMAQGEDVWRTEITPRFRAIQKENTLLGIHNITEDNLFHAIKMGGLANPSTAIIDIEKSTFNKYGEISLLMPSELVVKSTGRNAGTWGADIYSPRYPRISVEVDNKISRKIVKITSILPSDSLTSYINNLAGQYLSDGLSAFVNSGGLEVVFLYEKGINTLVKEATKFPAEVKETFRKADLGYDYLDIRENREANKLLTELYLQKEPAEKRELLRQRFITDGILNENLLRNFFNELKREINREGKIDEQQTISEARKIVNDNYLDEYKKWALKKYEELDVKEQIFDGYTPSGRRRYLPHTLENVSKWMKKQGRQAGESYFYGLGSIRALVAPTLNTKEKIRANRHLIVGKIDFEAAKAEVEKLFEELSNKLSGTHSYFIGAERLGEVVTSPNPKKTLEEYGIHPTIELLADIAVFKNKLITMPTEYFETKFERPVAFNEFAGALVPADVNPETLQALEDNGISIRTYEGVEQRMDKLSEFAKELSKRVESAPLFRTVSSVGFYSTVEEALSKIQQEKGTKAQFKQMLLKNGAKQAEMDWMEFDELPEKLTKADIQNWIDENRIEVKEVEKGTSKTFGREQAIEYLDKGYEIYGIDDSGIEFLIEDSSDIDRTDRFTTEEGLAKEETKFSKYTLPGGENYKELLLTMPNSRSKIELYKSGDAWVLRDENGYEEYYYTEQSALDAQNKKGYNEKFKSDHYDEPNILAHIRFDERIVNGERVLFIEEFQSDWAQAGRKKGFKNMSYKEYHKLDERRKELERIGGEYRNKEEEIPNEIKDEWVSIMNRIQPEKRGSLVPDMPFKKTDQWVNLAARRMMRYAAEKGFDRIAWTNGEQQADRYDLSKQVDDIWTSKYSDSWNGKQFEKLKDVEIMLKGESVIKLTINESGKVVNGNFIGESLDNIVGNEIAEKIINAKKDTNFGKQDLKVGGGGMRAFYDGIVPSAMSKLGKPFGAKVETVDLNNGYGFRMWQKSTGKYLGEFKGSYINVSENGERERRIPAEYKTPAQVASEIGLNLSDVTVKYDGQSEVGLLMQQSIPVTDSMKESVMEGVPLFRMPSSGFSQKGEEKDPSGREPEYKGQGLGDFAQEVNEYNSKNGSTNTPVSKKSINFRIGENTKPSQGEVNTANIRHNLAGHQTLLAVTEKQISDAAEKLSRARSEEKKAEHKKTAEALRAKALMLKNQIADYEEQLKRVSESAPRPAWKPGMSLTQFAKEIDEWNKKTAERFTLKGLPKPPVITSNMSVQEVADMVKKYKQITGEVFKDVNKEMGKIRRIYTEFIDRARPLEKLLKLMVEKGAVISPKTNAYMDFITSAGKSTALVKEYNKTKIKPLQNILEKLVSSKKLDNLPAYRWNILNEATGERHNDKPIGNYDRISLYLQAKDIEEADSMEDIAERGAKGFKKNVHDMRGNGIRPKDYIAEFEKAAGQKTIDAIWDKVRAINRWALDLQLDYELITREVYDEYTNGNRQYYVPQRGWRERDISGNQLYYVVDKSETPDNPFNSALVKARGRNTLAGDPLAYMQSIGESTVAAAMKNYTKRVFLEFAEQNADFARLHDFFAFKRVYYINTEKKDQDGNLIYERTYEPPSKEQLEEDKETNKELQAVAENKKKTAKLHDRKEISNAQYVKQLDFWNKKAAMLSEKLNVKYTDSEAGVIKQITSKERKQHTVTILREGKEYEIVFSQNYGGERVANVLNRNFSKGIEGEISVAQKSAEIIRKGTRYMSAMMTQYNPSFAVANGLRDYGIASISNLSEFGLKYQWEFQKNIFKVQGAVMRYAAHEQFDTDKDPFVKGYYGEMLREFFESGAATGWTYLKDVDQLRTDMKRAIDPTYWDTVLRGNYGVANAIVFKQVFGMFTEISELTTRFAEYVTSREQKNADGTAKYTRIEAATHAKDVSVNFDRKGNNKFFGNLFSFFNSSIQGTNKLFRMIRDPKVRNKLISTSATLMVGGMLQAMLMPDPEDDDERMWTEWELMNNICLGRLKIPLPQGLRAFWGMGVQIGLAGSGKKNVADSLLDGTTYFLGELVPEQMTFWMNGLRIDDRTGKLKYDTTLAMRGIVPTGLQPLYDVWQNTNFMGGTSYRTEFTAKGRDTKSERTLGKNNVNELAQRISDGLWKVGGGDIKDGSRLKKDGTEVVSGIFDINPSVIETVARGYSAGTGKFAMDMVQLAVQVFDPEKKVDVSTMAIANVLWKQPREYSPLDNKVWDVTGKTAFYKTQFNDIKKNNPERYRRITQFHSNQENQRLLWSNKDAFQRELDRSGTKENKLLQLTIDAEQFQDMYNAGQIGGKLAEQQADLLIERYREFQ